jgi:peptide/nickel transport system permease protein
MSTLEQATGRIWWPRGTVRRRFGANTALLAGSVLFTTVCGFAIVGPVIVGTNPTEQDLTHILAAPSGAHLLGTDQLGRDVLVRLMAGTRVDLQIAVLAIVCPFTIGCLIGCLVGYFGGIWDTIVMRLIDIIVAFPFYVLIIALVFVLGSGARSIYIAITMVGWVAYARIVRGEVLVARNQEYVAAAQLSGFSDRRVIFRHILPNVISQAVIFAMSDVVLTMLAIVTLGYLGLGVTPPTPDLGGMILDGQVFLSTKWWLSTVPGAAVVLTGLSLSLIADGLTRGVRP